MTVIGTLAQIRDAISNISSGGSTDFSGVEERLDCICQAINGIEQTTQPPSNYKPLPPQNLQPEPATPLPTDANTTDNRACQAAIYTARHLRHVIDQLANIVAYPSGLDSDEIAELVGSVGDGGQFVHVTATLLTAIISYVGIGLGELSLFLATNLQIIANQIDDNLFTCEFIGLVQSSNDTWSADYDALKMSVDATLDGLLDNFIVASLVKSLIWPEKLQSFVVGQAYDSQQNMIALDYSGIPTSCACDQVEYYGDYVQLFGYPEKNIFGSCQNEVATAFQNTTGVFARGVTCSGDSNKPGSGYSGFIVTGGAGTYQRFTIETDRDLTVWSRVVSGSSFSNNVTTRLYAIINGSHSLILQWSTPKDNQLHSQFFENLPAGNYEINYQRSNTYRNYVVGSWLE
jgi:hypothetical protein